jgi:NRPS condensation-like uncharacterized protein
MGDATLCAVMEFDRRLDARLLEEAAHACMLAHPVLHSRLVRGRGPAFWEMFEPASVYPLRVEECTGHYYPRVIGPVNPYEPQQFHVRLLRRPLGDVIVINLAHAAADAFGLQTLASQLLAEYHKPGIIRPAEGGIPERDTHWTRGLEREQRHVQSELRVINPLWPDPFGTSTQPSSFHRESIGPPVLGAVHEQARTLGGSINDVLMAAYFLSMSDLTGHQGLINIFFPVNLRQHLKDESRVMSNQATNVCIALERGPGEGMGEILPRVIEETRLLKKNGIGISEQVGMDTACDSEGTRIHQMVEQMVSLQKEGLADIFITNPGQIALHDGVGLTDAYICYPGGYMPTTCFTTSTFRELMTITMGYQNSERARMGTQQAMHLFVQYILSLF